jgi:hypothetical protein
MVGRNSLFLLNGMQIFIPGFALAAQPKLDKMPSQTSAT